jgi:hypothetical protein
VPIVSGYVRCPKCHAALPYGSGRIKRTTVEPGGTAVDSGGGFPWAAVIVAVVVAGVIAVIFGFRGGSKKQEPVSMPAEPVGSSLAPSPVQTPTAPTPAVAAAQPAAPSPRVLAADLDRQLKRQRLWANVSVSGDRVDVRSQSCGDPQMKPALDAGTAGFHAAGLTKLRCMEESGHVVFERDL